MVPYWLYILAIISLALAGLSALIIAADEVSHPQQMAVMNWVWPINALYFGAFGLWAYFAIGRKSSKKEMSQMHHEQSAENKSDNQEQTDPIKKAEQKAIKPFWQIVGVGVTHCGSGCTLGDIIGEWLVFWTGWTVAGAMIWPEYIADFVLAYLLGIIFQYFSIVPMRHLSFSKGIGAAIKADTLSLTAFEVGLFGWMALTYFILFHPHLNPRMPTYWFMMQIGMIIGFFTSYPINWWLIRSGIKEAM